MELSKRPRRLGKHEDGEATQNGVEARIGELEVFGVHDGRRRIGNTSTRNRLPQCMDHRLGEVDADNSPRTLGSREEHRTLSRGDVENLHSVRQVRPLDQRTAEMREVARLDLVIEIGRSSEDTDNVRLCL